MARLAGSMHLLLLMLICASSAHSYVSRESRYQYLPDGVLRMTSVILEPYLMENPDYYYDNAQPRFIGFIPDLLKEISDLTGMNYVIMTSPDNSFGYRQSNGAWDGMIGELLSEDADVAAGPMYATTQRSKAVEFTTPFLDVHATLLLRKPAPGVKLKIRSVIDLINQSEIKYGTLNRGILVHTYKNTNSTMFRMMWRNMLRFEPSVFTNSNEDGISRVRMDKYAFVIPHTIGEYMSMQEPCDLVTVDRFLMDRGYCLAVNKGSELLQQFNLAIRTLRDNGRLAELYRTWWIGRSQCYGITPHNAYGSAFMASSPSERLHACIHFSVLLLIVNMATCIYATNPISPGS